MLCINYLYTVRIYSMEIYIYICTVSTLHIFAAFTIFILSYSAYTLHIIHLNTTYTLHTVYTLDIYIRCTLYTIDYHIYHNILYTMIYHINIQYTIVYYTLYHILYNHLPPHPRHQRTEKHQDHPLGLTLIPFLSRWKSLKPELRHRSPMG